MISTPNLQVTIRLRPGVQSMTGIVIVFWIQDIVLGDNHSFPLLTPNPNISHADWLPSNTPTIWVCRHLSNKVSSLSLAAACTVNQMYLVVIAKLLVSMEGIGVIRSCWMA